MTVWKNCRVEDFVNEDESSCEVRINGRTIIVSHKEGGGWITYKGSEVGSGHYKLHSDHGGTATLHRAPASDFLEGFWISRSEEGMWRIELGEKSD